MRVESASGLYVSSGLANEFMLDCVAVCSKLSYYSEFTGRNMVRLADNSLCFLGHLFLQKGGQVSFFADSSYLGANFTKSFRLFLSFTDNPLDLQNIELFLKSYIK